MPIVWHWWRLGYQIDPALLSLYRFGGLSHIAVRGMLLYAKRITEEQNERHSWEMGAQCLGSGKR